MAITDMKTAAQMLTKDGFIKWAYGGKLAQKDYKPDYRS